MISVAKKQAPKEWLNISALIAQEHMQSALESIIPVPLPIYTTKTVLSAMSLGMVIGMTYPEFTVEQLPELIGEGGAGKQPQYNTAASIYLALTGNTPEDEEPDEAST